ncbi:MAG: HDOD domain-containing protein [Candidatus Contendobacter sp.]|jgi:putative nucleotidyltransferase with HDIG domain|nr:HDOD domain-containing protein [Gammaproteobacteria bacterium]MCC8993981.1 HDOD domain-containing protein [Candidatus Contendobacter sp.]
MKRILFVDDEPPILEGLQNLLRKNRRKWDMSFAVGGEAALELLKTQSFDVLVSDMRMPGVDGAQLLRYAKDHHPKTVRIILSGHMELKMALQAVPVAHQFLSKPCDALELENVVERACGVQDLLNDDTGSLRQMIGRINQLPSAPKTYHALMQALAEDRAGIDEIARLLKQDMAICAKLLQVVNSAFFRLARRIANVEEAVRYLGFVMVRNLALTVEVFQSIEPLRGLSLEALQEHALRVAALAKRLCRDKAQADDAFMAGLLHDIGYLILATEMSNRLEQALRQAAQEQIPPYQAEYQLLGVSHAEIGAYLLGLWGLPYPIIEAVANHHQPQRVPQRSFDVLAAVYLANLLVHETTALNLPGGQSPDPAYLESLGVTLEQLAEWRELALEQTQ